jgi:hypothetical protein
MIGATLYLATAKAKYHQRRYRQPLANRCRKLRHFPDSPPKDLFEQNLLFQPLNFSY